MRVHALIHAPFEGLGVIQEWLKKNDYLLYETHSYRGDVLPAVKDFDWLIVMGGPQNLKSMEKYPYLQDEIRLISQAVSQNKLVLGICLGAQLIAESLGAKTTSSPEKEIGVFPLQLTEKGHADHILRHFPEEFLVTHWHSDMPGLPASAEVLAASSGCPRQILRFKPRVYGLQCHFELTSADLKRMIEHDPTDLTFGRYTQTQEELLHYNYSKINQLMFLFLDHFARITVGVDG